MGRLMRNRIVIILLAAAFLFACGRRDATSSQNTLTVAAASDLKFALDQAAAEFKRERPDIEVKVAYGSSGNFYTQIKNGAPFDLFLSADMDYPRELQKNGLAIPGTDFEYAVGRLVVWTTNKSPIDVERLQMGALLEPSIRHIAIANPEHAPYGRAAVAAMRKLGVYDKVRDKFVLGENVSQTLQFVESGAAEIGIVAMSLAKAPAVASHGKYWELPLDSYPRMDQGGVILASARRRDLADVFRSFLLSPHGRGIFKTFGFYIDGD
jgi:molybdate transport system substrate-binding protein